MTDLTQMYEPGTVVRYTPENRWCREGLAVADEQGRLIDTYWASGGDVLSGSEMATAESVFSLRDYRELAGAERYRWEDYHSNDRQIITSQHGLRRRLFVRVGASPDLDTRIENAREAVRDAEETVSDAERALQWRRDELALLINGGES